MTIAALRRLVLVMNPLEKKMSFHRPTRLQLAVHEAGHAYAYAALIQNGIPVEMGLGVDADGGHHGWSKRDTLLYREVFFRSLPAECIPAVEWQADIEIAVAIAGPLSEFRHRHRSRWAALMIAVENIDAFLRPDTFDTDGDFARIRATLAHVEETAPAQRFKEMIFVAEGALSANWRRINGLARLLFDRSVLDETELARWFDIHPAARESHPVRPPHEAGATALAREQRID